MKKYIVALIIGILVVYLMGYVGELINQLMIGSTSIFQAANGSF